MPVFMKHRKMDWKKRQAIMSLKAIFIWVCCGFAALLATNISSAQPGKGLPVWSISTLASPGFHVIDWKTAPYTMQDFNIPSPTIHCPAVPAVSSCGEPVFHVRHSGVPNAPNNLLLYSPNGDVLLDSSTPNGPGLNAKRTAYEIQVIKVPQTLNEWFIIYPKWVSDAGAPIGNGGYVSSNLLYSRVRYRCREIEVLERDIVVKANNIAYRYSTALAVSATPDPDVFYLYANRRYESDDFLSLDRFKIENGGISWDKNTGNIAADFSIFAIDASPLAVSNDGKRIALCNRNANIDDIDFILFDAEDFSNAPGSCQKISAGDLILQPDNQLLFTAMTVQMAAASVPSLDFLQHMERKLVHPTFSPSGEYLYFTHGGFNGTGSNDYTYTYLGQIEIGTYSNPEPYPYKLRLQIEEPPYSIPGREDFDGTRHIQQSFDGNFYFIKWTTPFLYVLPNPDSELPNDLIPHKLDFSDSSHPNISFNGTIWYSPDQIDGFDYVTSTSPVISLGNDTVICEGNSVSLSPGGQFESYCWQDGSSNPVFQVTSAGEYWVEIIDEFGCFAYDTIEIQFFTEQISLGNDTVMCEGDSLLITPGNSYVQYKWQDGSTGSDLLVKSAGEYWVEVLTDQDCIGKDTVRVSTLSESVDLGTDVAICDGDSVYLSPGTGFTDYLWQDGSVSQGIFAKEGSTYWVEVTASGGCKASDTIEIAINPSPEVDLGQDTIIEIGETLELDAGPGLVYYFWQDGSSGRYFEVKQQGTYWVTVRNENCEASDTIYVIVDDCVASLTIPNCFTPNGDGFNDRFNVVGSNLNNFELLIFNRWGQLIFETKDINEGWDGKVNGVLSATGTYFYLVKYSTLCSSGVDKSGNKAGSVTLLE
jgi:gliding motility-associated-like protein